MDFIMTIYVRIIRVEFSIFTENQKMLEAIVKKHTFIFKQPGGTSRGVLTSKNSWYLIVFDTEDRGCKGIGECSLIERLSIDDRPDFEKKLTDVANSINDFKNGFDSELDAFPAIRFGLETALLDLKTGGKRVLFDSDFTNGKKGININGLVWMGSYNFMRRQIIEKIEAGYRCIKLKIGAINFEDELSLLKLIRKDFNEKELEVRVDANGAFKTEEALEKLKRLSEFELHSIEQPIAQGKWKEMAKLCERTPLPIALDEELIGISSDAEMKNMLSTIQPQYIILKPGLIGGFKKSNSFIKLADENKIGWWVTSALEGNIGLNAIAQWTATLNNPMPQGLGTGQLFSNNVDSPLLIRKAKLYFDTTQKWNLSSIFDE